MINKPQEALNRAPLPGGPSAFLRPGRDAEPARSRAAHAARRRSAAPLEFSG